MPAESLRPARRIGWGTTLVTITAALTALSAPTATADLAQEAPGIWDCSTSPCTEPSTYVVGHPYIFSTGSPGGTDGWQSMDAAADFYDNGKCIGSVKMPTSGGPSVTWVPTTAGQHKLTLSILTVLWPVLVHPDDTIPVTVVAAPPGSPAPTPQPQQGTCVTFGSSSLGAGTGSGNLIPGSSGLGH
ncbi:hypothetical protein ACWELJ_12275 [Nocardia sp. NPDC004582]